MVIVQSNTMSDTISENATVTTVPLLTNCIFPSMLPSVPNTHGRDRILRIVGYVVKFLVRIFRFNRCK